MGKMVERAVGYSYTSEENLTSVVIGAATGLALAEIVGLPRVPTLDLAASVAILNVFGIPVTPMLESVKNTLKDLRKK